MPQALFLRGVWKRGSGQGRIWPTQMLDCCQRGSERAGESGPAGRGGGLQLSSEDSSLCSDDPEGKEGISDEGPPL